MCDIACSQQWFQKANPTSEINVPARSGGTELHRALPGRRAVPGRALWSAARVGCFEIRADKNKNGQAYFEIRADKNRFRTCVF